MPQIDPDRAYLAEFDSREADRPLLENPENDDSPNSSTTELVNKLRALETHIYDNPQQAPGKLIDKSVLLAQLVALGEMDRQEQLRHSVASAVREVHQLNESYPPHLSWAESYLHIFIDEKHLDPRRFEKANLDTGQSITDTESDVFVDYRRNAKQRGLTYAVESVRNASLLELLQPAAETADTESETFQSLVHTLASAAEREPSHGQKEDNKVAQAQSALEVGILQTGETRKNLLNLALDTATTALDSLPEEPNPARAAAYLVAATSVHDLASQPDSFLPRLTEHEARDFRVRALEIASYWATQAAETYRKVFGLPVGNISPQSLPEIVEKIRLVTKHTKSINDAFWFEGIYENDFIEAASKLDHGVRKIGQGAVIIALKQQETSEQPPAQQAIESAEAAA